MTNQYLPLVLAVAVAVMIESAPAFAHKEGPTESSTTSGPNVADAALDVDANAAAAVATVERFTAALSAGEIDKAAAELDPKVLIYESGGVEQSRAEYLAGHAAADAEFLKGARVKLKSRSGDASGDLAWVSSESEIHATKGAETLIVDSTETMMLRRSAGKWKIVHIHWSSGSARAQRTD